MSGPSWPCPSFPSSQRRLKTWCWAVGGWHCRAARGSCWGLLGVAPYCPARFGTGGIRGRPHLRQTEGFGPFCCGNTAPGCDYTPNIRFLTCFTTVERSKGHRCGPAGSGSSWCWVTHTGLPAIVIGSQGRRGDSMAGHGSLAGLRASARLCLPHRWTHTPAGRLRTPSREDLIYRHLLGRSISFLSPRM